MHNVAPGGRQSAVNRMRTRAEKLEREARQWRALADAIEQLDAQPAPVGSHFSAGSEAEELLWRLACAAELR